MEQSPGYLLWHASRRWRRELAAALAPLKLTYAEWALLASLHFLAPPSATMNGEPCAVKVACTVRKAIEREGLATVPRSQSTLHRKFSYI